MNADSIVADAVKAQSELADAFAELVAALQPQLDSPGMAPITALGDVMAGLTIPVRTDDLMDEAELATELLRTWDVHGDGLRVFDPTLPAQTSDVLIGSDRTLWIITAVDKDGRVTETAGMPRGKPPKAMILLWRPATAAREWLVSGQTAAPAYSDLGRAMTHMVRLSGERQYEGRDFADPASLFRAVLEAPGLSLDAGDLTDADGDAAITAFCVERGGLRSTGAGTVTPGDLLRLGATRQWALVTRAAVQASTTTLDVLAGNIRRKGSLGEAADALQMLRGYSLTADDRVWRPAKPV